MRRKQRRAFRSLVHGAGGEAKCEETGPRTRLSPLLESSTVDSPRSRSRSTSDGDRTGWGHVSNSAEDDLHQRMVGLYKYLRVHGSDKVYFSDLIQALEAQGIVVSIEKKEWRQLYENAYKLGMKKETIHLSVDASQFDVLVNGYEEHLLDCLGENVCIPKFQEFCHEIDELVERVVEDYSSREVGKDGITCVSCSARDSPTCTSCCSFFEIAICSISGQQYLSQKNDTGLHSSTFSMEEICKPLLYCLACEMDPLVEEYLSHEVSGMAVDSFVLQNKRGKTQPHNPLMNTGSLVSSSFINGKEVLQGVQPCSTVQNLLSRLFVRFCEATVDIHSRKDRDRNYGLAYMLRDSKCLPNNSSIDGTLEVYFNALGQICTLKELSYFAATLANGGTHPLTRERIFQKETMHHCLSVLYTCGMGLFSGEWAFHIGLPAVQCSINGVILAVIPGLMGICTRSCALDTLENSLYGIQFFRQLTTTFNFHQFDIFDTMSAGGLRKDPGRKAYLYRESIIQRLLQAAADGDICEIRRLHSSGLDLDSKNYDGRTALHLAACEGKLSVAKYLVRHDVDLSPLDRFGGTPLSDAQRHNQDHIVSLLGMCLQGKRRGLKTLGLSLSFRKGSHLDVAPSIRMVDIKCFYAVYAGNIQELMELHVHEGADLNVRDYDYRTLLHIAAAERKVDIVKYLLQSNVDLQPEDRHGRKPLDEAKTQGNSEIVQILSTAIKNARSDVSNGMFRTLDSSANLIKSCSSLKENRRDSFDSDMDVSSHSGNQYLSSGVQKDGQNVFQVAKLLDILKSNGLADDPRLRKMIRQADLLPVKTILSYDQFCHITASGAVLLDKAILEQLTIPNFEDFCDEIVDIFEHVKRNVSDGKVATYIPQLAVVDEEKFGLALCTVDGQRFDYGDSNDYICVQSCSKTITYCLAVEELGLEKVHFHVGCEPSGLSFNELNLMKRVHKYPLTNTQDHSDEEDDLSLSEQDDEYVDMAKPHNPMINAGAIMTSALIRKDLSVYERFEYVMDTWKALCGELPNDAVEGFETAQDGVRFNNSVYLSERVTADRNYCLGYMMKESGCFPESTDLREVLDFYFQQCSISCSAKQLSVLASTLANGGVCPITNQRVFQATTVTACLSLMYSCGMYDFSGTWSYSVGIPAKSGVSGAILLVIPNVLGCCVWSPRLDPLGNSTRGIAFCKQLVSRFNFHAFDSCLESTNKETPMLPSTAKHYRSGEQIQDRIMYLTSQNDLMGLRQLLLKYPRIKFSDILDADGQNPLHVAVGRSYENMARFLLQHNVDPHQVDRWGKKPIDYAKSNTDLYAALLEKRGGHPVGSLSSNHRESMNRK